MSGDRGGAEPGAPASGAPDVSVVIPTYNRRDYVREAVDSCLRQAGCRVEVIVVDDGSTDDTPSALSPYGARIRYVRTPNAGQNRARNTGMALLSGRYVKFLDSDDYLEPDSLAKEVAHGDATGCDVVCTGWGEFMEGEKGTRTLEKRVHVPDLEPGDPIDHVLNCRGVVMSAALYRRSAIVGLTWDPQCPKATDWDWFCSVALSGGRFACLDIVSFWYRHHAAPRDSTATLYKSALHREWQWRKVEARLRQDGGLTPAREALLAQRYFLALYALYEHDRARFEDLCLHITELAPRFRPVRANRVARGLIAALGLRAGIAAYMRIRKWCGRLA